MKREFELEQQLSSSQDTIVRLQRQLSQAKLKTDVYVRSVEEALSDAARGLKIKPVPAPAKVRRAKANEVAVAVLSDWQLAKKTPSYDTDACERRVALYGDKVLELTDIQRNDHAVPELRVWLLGDIVEGELIFPGQAHLIDSSLYRQVAVDGPRILCNFLRRMCANFEQVHVVGVIGNHGALGGRSRRDYNPESNADRMLYTFCEQLLVDQPNLSWAIPAARNERDWYAVDHIGEKRALLFHGDQIRGGFAGMPWYGFSKKVQGWANGAVNEEFDYAVCGHWHQPTSFVLNKKRVWVNGSTESDNTYAQEQLAAAGRPSQWLMFAHPKRGVTAEYCVWLDD